MNGSSEDIPIENVLGGRDTRTFQSEFGAKWKL